MKIKDTKIVEKLPKTCCSRGYRDPFYNEQQILNTELEINEIVEVDEKKMASFFMDICTKTPLFDKIIPEYADKQDICWGLSQAIVKSNCIKWKDR